MMPLTLMRNDVACANDAACANCFISKNIILRQQSSFRKIIICPEASSSKKEAEIQPLFLFI